MKEDTLSKISMYSCWSLSLFFFLLFFLYAGFPPNIPEALLDLTYLVVAMFFFVFPFVSRIKIGEIVSLEKEIAQTKREVEQHKEFTHQMITSISAGLSSVAKVSNSIGISVMGESKDPIKPTPLNEMVDVHGGDDLVYLKNRMAYSVADENSREDIDSDDLQWAFLSDEIFWLAQNLTYIKANLISGGPNALILRTLGQAYAHLKNLGIEKSKSAMQISAIRFKIHQYGATEIDFITREKFVRAIQECIYRIGALCYEFQEKHKKAERDS